MISVIIPTLNRPSLEATLASCSEADQVILMPDPNGESGCYGHALRNRALDESLVTSEWVASIDDDDVYLPGAFGAIKQAIVGHPNGPWFVFKMTFGDGSHCPGVIVWHNEKIREGNVGTPMIVAPANAKARWGVEPVSDAAGDERPGWLGDLVYAQRLRDELGEPVWVDTVIACVRPESGCVDLNRDTTVLGLTDGVRSAATRSVPERKNEIGLAFIEHE